MRNFNYQDFDYLSAVEKHAGGVGSVGDEILVYPETFEIPLGINDNQRPMSGFPLVGFACFSAGNAQDAGNPGTNNGRYFGYGNILRVFYSDIATFDVGITNIDNDEFLLQGWNNFANLKGGTTGLPFLISAWVATIPANGTEFLFFIPRGSTIQITGTVDVDSLVEFVDSGFYYFSKQEPQSESNVAGFVCKWDGRHHVGQLINPEARSLHHIFYLVSSGRPVEVSNTNGSGTPPDWGYNGTYGLPWSFALCSNLCYDRFEYDSSVVLYGLNVDANQTLENRLRDFGLVGIGKYFDTFGGGFQNPDNIEFSLILQLP